MLNHDPGEERQASDNAGSARWLLTYADMITLLMIFFIMLYTISKTDQAKYNQIALALHAALTGQSLDKGLPQAQNTSLIPLSPTPAPATTPKPATEAGQAQAKVQTQLQQMQAQIQKIIGAEGTNAQAKVTDQGLDISFSGDTVYFASGQADLQPHFKALLTKIAPVLKEAATEIRVEGYTNDLPLHSTVYATAWELSSARADNVVRYLTEDNGVPPHQMEVVAYGQWHPRYPNDSATDLAANRSVDIVVTRDPPPGLDTGGPDVAPPNWPI